MAVEMKMDGRTRVCQSIGRGLISLGARWDITDVGMSDEASERTNNDEVGGDLEQDVSDEQYAGGRGKVVSRHA